MPRSDPAIYAQGQRAERLTRCVGALILHSDPRRDRRRRTPTVAEVLDSLAVAGLMLVEDDGTNAARHAWDVMQQRERKAAGC